MKFNISDIILKKYDSLNVEYDLIIDKIQYLGEEICILKPITLTGEFYRVGKEIGFEGKIETITHTSCHRCLKEMTTEVEFSVSEMITGDGEENDYDFLDLVTGEEVDLDEFIERLILLKQPTVFLCNEDCKGLCPTCGVNRNDEECDCDNEDVDIRLLKLKELLEQD